MDAVMGVRRRVLTGLACATALAAACSSGGDTDSRSPLEVDVTSELTFRVADDVSLFVQPGDFVSVGTIAAVDTDVEHPDLDWFDSAGGPVDLVIDGEVASPLTLTFDGSSGPEGSIPVILRYDKAEGWYPIGVAGDDGLAAVERETFSPLSWGWARLQDLSETISGSARNLLGDRHDPPHCSAGPPSWFAVDAPAIDVVHVCATANIDSDDGSDRGEARVVNNRGVILEVQVPAGADYAWVDGQPDSIRAATRAFTARDSILLAPGQLMTVGFAQPVKSAYTPLRVDHSGSAVAATVLLEVIGDTGAYAAVYQALARCGAAPEPLDVRLRGDDLGDVVSIGLACFTNLASDPQSATTLAAEAVAAMNGVT
ncbi:MAG: hypothetical protein ACT4OV_11425, partial [Microthrixaceae bacterium]